MRPTIRRTQPSAPPKRTLKDWLDLALPVATLILGVVSLWTTIQISGLEDYFRSEIVRRNADIGLLSERSLLTENRLVARERRVEELTSAAGKLGILNEEQRLVLSRTAAELSQLRSQAMDVQGALDAAIEDRRRLESDVLSQTRSLELLHRQEVYNAISGRHFAIWVNALAGLDRSSPGQRHIGSEFRQLLMTMSLSDARLSPYLAEVKREFDLVCPAISTLAVTFPARPADPDFAAPPFRPIRSATDREEFMALWELKNNTEASAYRQWTTEYSEQLTATWDRVTGQFESCVCSALATETIRQSEVCPPA